MYIFLSHCFQYYFNKRHLLIPIFSGELVQSITEYPITDEKIPYGMSKLIKINGHTCRVLRVSYVGELGFELHIPFASCVPVYNKVMEAGRGFELKHAGFRAYDSLACEKGNKGMVNEVFFQHWWLIFSFLSLKNSF